MSKPSDQQQADYQKTPQQTAGCLTNFRHASHINHTHPEVELVCLLAGNASLLIGSHVQQGQAGDVFLIGSQLPHAITPATGNEAGVLLIHFTESYFSDVFALMKDFQPMARLMAQSFRGMMWRAQMDGIIPKVLKLRNVRGVSTVIASVEILSTLASQKPYMLLNQTRFEPGHSEEQADEKMRKIFDYTLERYREAITLSQIAATVNFTETSFCRYFKRYTGKSYYQYLNEVRIDKACMLLISDGPKSIEEVCYITGYSSPSTFYKHFKKVLGMTPKEYQARAHILRPC